MKDELFVKAGSNVGIGFKYVGIRAYSYNSVTHPFAVSCRIIAQSLLLSIEREC